MLLLVLGLAVSACGNEAETPNDTPGSLVVYSGRSESLVDPIIQQFKVASGIDVKVRYGGTAEMAATILEEGENSPADVFFAQDPAGLGAVAGRFAPLPESILGTVPAKYRSPEGVWVGLSGRARVTVYNTDKLSPEQLPDDIWGFTDPQWKGRIGWAPTNGSFQAMVTAMQVQWGEEKTRDWLIGIKANEPKAYSNNTSIVAAVGSGEVEVGFPNHYYLYRFLQEEGESFAARNYHFRESGPGGVMLVAGAGILETAPNRENADRFLQFMLSLVAQQYFASQTYEYPVIERVIINRLLTPLEEINAPDIDMADLDDLEGTLALLRETGILP
ncbi:MAG: iron ABC transporter substrate-binding protein [Chloroflexi bacterium]|nr:iron ABC transporter substrate-binding protein [Chloroflexota bacterium]